MAQNGRDIWMKHGALGFYKYQVNARVMQDMHELRKDKQNMPMPFDMTRMAYGGFQVEVEG